MPSWVGQLCTITAVFLALGTLHPGRDGTNGATRPANGLARFSAGRYYVLRSQRGAGAARRRMSDLCR